MLSRAIVPKRTGTTNSPRRSTNVMEGVKIGYSEDPETQLGPLAMKRQLERVEMYIEEGKKSADLVTGGSRPAHLNKGYFIEPTLFANVDNKQPHRAGGDLRPGPLPDPGRGRGRRDPHRQ